MTSLFHFLPLIHLKIMRRLSFLLLAAFVLFGCNEYQKNKLKISYGRKLFTNHILRPNFGYYTQSCYFTKNNLTQQYLYFNNKETLILDDSTQTLIKNTGSASNQNFALNAWGETVYRLETNGMLSVLQNNRFQHLLNLNKLPELKSISLIVSAYYQGQNYCHMYKGKLVFPLISSKNLLKPYPMFGTYDLKTQKIKVLNIRTDKEFLNYKYGSKNIFSSYLKGDTLVIHYPFRSEITLFSLSTDRIISKINLFYNQHSDEIKELSKETKYELYRYNIESPAFGSIFYNPYKKHYYRFYQLSLDRMNENEEYTIEQDKKNTVLIYDSNFNYLAQVFLPKKYFLLNELTPTKKGFILNTNFKVTNKQLIFDEINY